MITNYWSQSDHIKRLLLLNRQLKLFLSSLQNIIFKVKTENEYYLEATSKRWINCFHFLLPEINKWRAKLSSSSEVFNRYEYAYPKWKYILKIVYSTSNKIKSSFEKYPNIFYVTFQVGVLLVGNPCSSLYTYLVCWSILNIDNISWT